jgi:soluble lytic murein transglycosylase-like protein
MTPIIAAIISAAKAASVPPALLLSICAAESNFRNVVSPSDGGSASFGPCQVKLGTARLFNKRVRAEDLLKPEVSTKYAALYLSYQLVRYGHNYRFAVAAYNSGSARTNSMGTFINQKYVNRVMRNWEAHASN